MINHEGPSVPCHVGVDILYENAQWWVSMEGMESKPHTLNGGHSFIPSDRLLEPRKQWIRHFSEKIWCDPRLLADAFYEACALQGTRFDRDVLVFVPDTLTTWIKQSWQTNQGWIAGSARSASEFADRIVEIFGGDGPEKDNSFALVRLNSDHAAGFARR